jgi:hypothetical protein
MVQTFGPTPQEHFAEIEQMSDRGRQEASPQNGCHHVRASIRRDHSGSARIKKAA